MSKAEFFRTMDSIGLALTFGDVLLKPGYSEVLPADVDVSTMFSRHVSLKIPIVSAAMDTVTGDLMAIELAKLGGLGVIHRGLSARDQAKTVVRVKMHMNGRINTPICVRMDDTIGNVLTMREERNFEFHTFPVTDNEGKLIGLLTRRRFEMSEDEDTLVSSAMTTDLVTAPEGTSLAEAYRIMIEQDEKVLPLIDGGDRLAGMCLFSDVKRIMSSDAGTHNVDSNGQLITAAAVGTGDEALERAELLVGKGVDVIVIDTAHGDSKDVFETLKELKSHYGDNVDIVAGNISQGSAAKRLVDAGADGIKVGQGPGSICTTRIVTGVGCPQVKAVYKCVSAIEGLGVPVCADGGIENSGEITIIIGAGAHSVMLGSLLAGTDEAPGTITTDPSSGQRVKYIRGMGSLSAMQESEGSRGRYRQDGTHTLVPEGIEGYVALRGSLADLVKQLVGGLRAGMGYVGAADIKELREKGEFDLLTQAGVKESHPHGVTGISEAPNYRRG
ncbi:MAG: IMP dehydrogenase [Patescibacteria group bacterium]|nr:IMP dehydrogenase [Patescibacteria group bacterium]